MTSFSSATPRAQACGPDAARDTRTVPMYRHETTEMKILSRGSHRGAEAPAETVARGRGACTHRDRIPVTPAGEVKGSLFVSISEIAAPEPAVAGPHGIGVIVGVVALERGRGIPADDLADGVGGIEERPRRSEERLIGDY